MSRFQTRRVARGISFRVERFAGSIAETELRAGSTAFEGAAETLRLKAALKRAVAKPDAPSYLIDAIRREIRK